MFDKTTSKLIFCALTLHASLLISNAVNADGSNRNDERLSISVEQYLGGSCRELLLKTSPANSRRTRRDQIVRYRNGPSVNEGDDRFPNERFALDVMIERGVVTPEIAAFFKSTSASVDPSLVSFVNIKDKAGNFLTMLRMVNGQRVVAADSHMKPTAVENVDLPWMTEIPELAKAHVNRKQQKFIYEWGRAASKNGAGLFQKNISLLTLLAARDVFLQGGSVDDAFVYIHTTQANSVHFEAKYRFRKVASNPHNTNHVILVKPLAELIAEYDPEHEAYGVGNASDLLGLSTHETVDFIYEASHVNQPILDIVSSRTGKLLGGITIHDDSLLTRYREISLDRHFPAKLRQALRIFNPSQKTLPLEKVFQGLPEFAPPRDGLRTVAEISIAWLSGGSPTDQELTEVLRSLRKYYIEQARHYGDPVPEDSFSEVLFATVKNESALQPYLNAGFRIKKVLKKSGDTKVLLEMPGRFAPLFDGNENSSFTLRPGMFEYTHRRYNPVTHK